MILTLLYYLLTTILYLFLFLLVLIITFVLWLKLKYEPVKRMCKSNVKLHGKTVLITGGNRGIGLETAKDLASRGARVIIACRDGKKAAEEIAEIISRTGNKNIEFKYLDLAKLSSIRSFVEDYNKSYDRLDILVNNAGCWGIRPKLTEDGVDVVMQVNYIGPFLLTNLLLDKMIASKPSRIVNVSSITHYLARLRVEKLGGMYEPGATGMFLQYCNTKFCEILWTKALAKRLPEGVTVNSLHPGIVNTDIINSLAPIYRKLVYACISAFFKTAREGAQTTIHVCVSEDLDKVTGKYFVECIEANYNKLADDDDVVESVWKKSIELTS